MLAALMLVVLVELAGSTAVVSRSVALGVPQRCLPAAMLATKSRKKTSKKGGKGGPTKISTKGFGARASPTGGQLLDEAGIKALASMPSLDELRGTIVGLVNAPATKIARVVNEPAGKLARVFGAYGAKEAA